MKVSNIKIRIIKLFCINYYILRKLTSEEYFILK